MTTPIVAASLGGPAAAPEAVLDFTSLAEAAVETIPSTGASVAPAAINPLPRVAGEVVTPIQPGSRVPLPNVSPPSVAVRASAAVTRRLGQVATATKVWAVILILIAGAAGWGGYATWAENARKEAAIERLTEEMFGEKAKNRRLQAALDAANARINNHRWWHLWIW